MLDAGDVYSRGFEVRNTSDVLTTPASNVCTITRPDLTTSTPTLTVPSTGVLRVDFPTTLVGRYIGHLVTVNPDGAHNFTFDVTDSSLDLVSLADAKTHLGIPATSTTDDEELRSFITAASAYLEGRYGPLARQTFTETRTPSRAGLLLSHYPVISLTSVAGAYGYTAPNTDVSTLHVTDAGMLCSNYGAAWLGCYPLTVTYVAGLITMPADVQKACLEIVKGLWDSQRGAAQTAFDAEMGGTEAMPGMGLTYWRADKLMEPYRKPVVA